MELGTEWIWKSALIVLGGIILLRLAGRKSISQMTLAQTVIMIGIGSLLIQPLAGKNIWSTLYVGALLVITLLIVEYGQLKFDFIEQLVVGKSKILIENGSLNLNILRSVRLTVDQLETQLRLNGISKINDVKWATIEPNGQIGFILKDEVKASTKQDIDTLKQEIQQLKQLINKAISTPNSQAILAASQTQQSHTAIQIEELNKQISDFNSLIKNVKKKNEEQDIFQEIKTEAHTTSPPKHLQ